ncbi:hypothetical protein [Citrobacter amalonaticus]|uniref:hypothetical protein n=1 Tax=Citrobacter amalonaticus TaxID=35703 RepID=UPI001E46C127|nr:hypothetical protein [Citrobacter amalonaticus]
MNHSLALDALLIAVWRHKPDDEVIVHSDSKNVGVSFHHHACCFLSPVRSLMQ